MSEGYNGFAIKAFRKPFLTFFLQIGIDANRGYGRALAQGWEFLAALSLPSDT
jgi:hypothetical protein